MGAGEVEACGRGFGEVGLRGGPSEVGREKSRSTDLPAEVPDKMIFGIRLCAPDCPEQAGRSGP